MTDVPDATPVTTPMLLIVATPGVPLDQVPPVVTLANGMVEPIQTLASPVMEETTGKALTVLVLLIEAVHPLPSV